MRDQFRVQCKDCPYAPKAESTPAIPLPDNCPVCAELSQNSTETAKNTNNISETLPAPKTCGDCSLLNHHSECEQVKGSHFYRDKTDKACKAGFVQREASA
jgi:hypothetical protein